VELARFSGQLEAWESDCDGMLPFVLDGRMISKG